SSPINTYTNVFLLTLPLPPISILFPYTTLFRSEYGFCYLKYHRNFVHFHNQRRQRCTEVVKKSFDECYLKKEYVYAYHLDLETRHKQACIVFRSKFEHYKLL